MLNILWDILWDVIFFFPACPPPSHPGGFIRISHARRDVYCRTSWIVLDLPWRSPPIRVPDKLPRPGILSVPRSSSTSPHPICKGETGLLMQENIFFNIILISYFVPFFKGQKRDLGSFRG
ncbi:hypothetical protein AMECASPLE_001093 [Ameca splendens]|uniref:Uncharacterized protein n=1 Tax=Ameca splendens TaxID=208324 RepID=A0ABV0XLZ7_9TELE